MIGYIYITTNMINGKQYIGMHKSSEFDFEHYKGSGKMLKRAFLKYGFENFECKLLEELNNVPTVCDTLQQLYLSEEYYISYFNCVESDEFYNLVGGGKGGDKIHFFPEEDRAPIYKKISDAQKGIKMTDRVKNKEAYLKKELHTVKGIQKNIDIDIIMVIKIFILKKVIKYQKVMF